MRVERHVLLAGLLCGIVTVSCASIPDPSRYTEIGLPSFAQFAGGTTGNAAGVHSFLENQCGTLDCHGQVGRPFRLYSENGLRAVNDAGAVSGAGGETSVEVYANFLSAVGLQPEQMSAVVAGQASPTTLLLVAKPLGYQSHKGGVRMLPQGYLASCLEGWLADPSGYGGDTFSASDCMSAAAVP
jgi:hypothetical protein